MELKYEEFRFGCESKALLIVLNGIEIKDLFHGTLPNAPFNRTKWN